MTIKTSNRPYDPNSLEDEGTIDYEDGLADLKRFESDAFGRLTVFLRRAAKKFTMAADRLDYAQHLKGNTLEEYVEEEKP